MDVITIIPACAPCFDYLRGGASMPPSVPLSLVNRRFLAPGARGFGSGAAITAGVCSFLSGGGVPS
jgi:hypothetical protein